MFPSQGFLVRASPQSSVTELRSLIKPSFGRPEHEHVHVNDLTLWKTSIVVDPRNNSVVNLHDIDNNKVLLLGDKILSDIFDCTSKKRGLELSESTVDIIVGTQMPALEPPRPLDNNEYQDFIPNHIKEEDAESEFPLIDNSNLNFSMVSNQFGLSNLEEPNIEDLRLFEHIGSGNIDTRERRVAWEKLLLDIHERIELTKPFVGKEMVDFTNMFIHRVSHLFRKQSRLSTQSTSNVNSGKVPFDIVISSKFDKSYMMAITKVHDHDFEQGIAKNVVQLDYISNRKRKFDDWDEDEHESDEDEDEDEDEDNSEYKDKSRDESGGESSQTQGSRILYGIVANSQTWCFVKRKPVVGSAHPLFCVSRVPGFTTYTKDNWKKRRRKNFNNFCGFSRRWLEKVQRKEESMHE
ncbi:hypothetical protein BGZ46_004380 [Entomortierella lignicola]|nr:hypothetical protein BGZ46_004380 [Entomortierella lignicola]